MIKNINLTTANYSVSGVTTTISMLVILSDLREMTFIQMPSKNLKHNQVEIRKEIHERFTMYKH